MKVGDLVRFNESDNCIGIIVLRDQEVQSKYKWWFVLYTDGDYCSVPECHLEVVNEDR